MGELLRETLSNHLGVQLLHWAFSQSDAGSIANRCVDFVSKMHEPLERGALVLDSILTVDEEEVVDVRRQVSVDRRESMERHSRRRRSVQANAVELQESGECVCDIVLILLFF